MNGILLVDKPAGWTSFDVVAKVRGMLQQSQSPGQSGHKTSDYPTPLPKVKVGHTGTLDPLATGLLVLVIGDYCKRAGEFSKLDKTYEVTMTLGFTSTTGDAEGEKTHVSDKKPTRAEIEAILGQFVGETKQIPPIYSAVRVNGKRAYKLARAGKEFKIEPRSVKIYSNVLKNFRMPEVFFETNVSSGTYIRSLVEDMGYVLGTGAFVTELRRTRVGNFDIGHAVAASELPRQTINSLTQNIDK